MSRRRAVRLLGSAVAIAAVPGLRPGTSQARPLQGCGRPGICSVGTVCGAEVPPFACNKGCCQNTGDPGHDRATAVCCAHPPPPNGPGSWCCPKGYTCGSGGNKPGDPNCACRSGVQLPDGTCGPCPSGEFQCGTHCCKGQRPTLPAEVCIRGQCRPACPSNTKKCGHTCCTSKQLCKNGKCCEKCGGSGACCNPATQFCCREPGKPKGPGRCCKKTKETCCGVGPPGAQKRMCCAKPNKCTRQLPSTRGGLTGSSPYVCCPPERQVPVDETSTEINACCAPGQVSLGGKLVVGPGIQGACCDAGKICGSGASITCCPTGQFCIGGTTCA